MQSTDEWVLLLRAHSPIFSGCKMTPEISKTPHPYPRNSSKVRAWNTVGFFQSENHYLLSWKMNSCLIHNFYADRYFDITSEIPFFVVPVQPSELRGKVLSKEHHIRIIIWKTAICALLIVTFYSCIKLHYELKNLLNVSSIFPLFNFDVIIFKFCKTEINHAIQTAVFELWHVHTEVFSGNSVIRGTLFP